MAFGRSVRALVLALVTLAALPLASSAGDGTQREFDAEGRLVAEHGPVHGRPGLAFERHYTRADATVVADGCGSTAYKLARWRWAEPYRVSTTRHAPEVAAALAAWDVETSRALSGGVATGVAGSAGSFDGANQIDWVDLGETSTIAVTTTWYSRASGIAVESDGQYNTRFLWSTSGARNAMDAQNILTHELGHTLGLDHPKGKHAACLTMHAYAALGETAKRTLGPGDAQGLRSLYGS